MSILLKRNFQDIRVEICDKGITIYPKPSLSGIFLSWSEIEQIIHHGCDRNSFLLPLIKPMENIDVERNNIRSRESNILSTGIQQQD